MKPQPNSRRVKAEALGRAAEDQAGQYLLDNGWTIINKRTKTRSGEIDIIASRDNVTAFIEVKARMHRDEAISAVTKKQAKRIIAAANYWLAQHPEAMMNAASM